MQEKLIGKKSNGMAVLIISALLYLAAIGAIIAGGLMLDGGSDVMLGTVLLAAGTVWACVGWIPFLGLKVIKPQEALVLTLFGKYVGTLKGDGFYFVNPFCVAVNPAAKTSRGMSVLRRALPLFSLRLLVREHTRQSSRARRYHSK